MNGNDVITVKLLKDAYFNERGYLEEGTQLNIRLSNYDPETFKLVGEGEEEANEFWQKRLTSERAADAREHGFAKEATDSEVEILRQENSSLAKQVKELAEAVASLTKGGVTNAPPKGKGKTATL